MDYGRENSMDWVLWKTANLDMNQRRAHNDNQGKIIWLIGSSILRESLSESWLNEQLASMDSEYRIIMLSMDRGNAGLAFGFLNKIQLQKGDIVIHNVSMNNFKTNWLNDFSTFTGADLMRVIDQQDLWEIEEWGLADKLEQASAIPPNFWGNHGTYMNGLTRWFTNGVQLKKPKQARTRYHLTHKNIEFEKNISTNISSKYYIPQNGFDFSERQFNVQGLQKMKTICDEHSVQFALFYIPPRQQYLAEMVHQDARQEYEKFLENLNYDLYYFPQLPETDYYDLTHPNFRGREQHNQYFLGWLTTPQKGEFPALTWAIPEYNK